MESLLDPLNDRIVKSIKAPPQKPLSSHLLFPKKNSIKFHFCNNKSFFLNI